MVGAGTADIIAALQGDAYLAIEGAESLVDLRTVLPDLDGPPMVCQQSWPSFMETATSKDHVSHFQVSAAILSRLTFVCGFRLGDNGL